MSADDVFVRHGKAGTPLNGLFVMDTHCHLGPTRRLNALDTTVDSVVPVMDQLGVDLAAVSAIPAAMSGILKGNDLVIDALQRYPDRFFGYMVVNPQYPAEAEAELDRCLDAGLRGIKVHYMQGTRYEEPCYDMVWEFAAAYDLPILAHAGGKDILEYESLFTRFPTVTWIMAHAGIADPEIYLQVGKEYENVILETCYSASPRGLIEYFVDGGMEDKLIWGTDVAFMSAAPQLGRVLFARITPLQKTKILGLNARRIFRLPEQ